MVHLSYYNQCLTLALVFYWQKLEDMVLQSQFCLTLCYAWTLCKSGRKITRFAGWGQRERKRGNFQDALLTYLANCYWLIPYSHCLCWQHSLWFPLHPPSSKVHLLWLYRIHIVPGPYCFVTFCWLPYHIDLGRPTKHHKFVLLHGH
jgi:hypothetical protein